MIDLTQSPEKLKASILQDAMQGKLTQQLPEDGEANDLLRSIEVEKQRLITEGKFKKQKTLPDIDPDEIPFEIPDNWKWVRLGNIVDINSGLSYKKGNLSDNINDVRIIRGGNISNNYNLIIKDDDYRISDEFVKNENVYLKEYQLIMPVSTSPKHTAKVAIVPKLQSRIAAGGFVYQITTFLFQKLFSKFLMYSLSNPTIRREIKEISNLSGSALCNIPKTKLMKILVPIPPINVQKRIVKKLNKLLPKIDSFSSSVNQISELREQLPIKLRKSFLQSAMQGQLTQQLPEDGDADDLLNSIKIEKQRLIGKGKIKKQKDLPDIDPDEVPFEIPDNWQWVRLGNITRIDAGHNMNKYVEGKGVFTYVKVSDMNLKGNEKEIHTSVNKITEGKYVLPEYTIIFPKIGGAIKTNKRRLVLSNNIVIDPNIMSLTTFIPQMIDYLWIYMKNTDLSTIQSGTSVPAINKTKVGNLLIPVPPLSEQQRIVTKLDSLFSDLNKI